MRPYGRPWAIFVPLAVAREDRTLSLLPVALSGHFSTYRGQISPLGAIVLILLEPEERDVVDVGGDRCL
jgi:hypothetical protein